MEYNKLRESGDWLELVHIIDYPSHAGEIIIARFNQALSSRAQVAVVAAMLGFELQEPSATLTTLTS